MTISWEGLEEGTESFVGKRGPQTVPLWICLDRSPEGRLRNTFDCEVNADEQESLERRREERTSRSLSPKSRISFGNRRQCPEDHGRGLLNGCHTLAQKSPGG
jgi:hypothetical protein